MTDTTKTKNRCTHINASTLWACQVLVLAVVLNVFGLLAKARADLIDIGPLVGSAGGQIEHTAIVIRRLSDGQVWSGNLERAQQQFSPAYTSKIPHTLIALERGLAYPNTIFSWDGAIRSVRVWNADHTLSSAFQNSVVWVYQEIARTAGPSVMSAGLADFAYGNMDIGSIDQLTTYWLDNTLKISAAEQVEFLSRLAYESLQLSAATYASARDIMVNDAGANWVMRSKTGWHYNENDMDIGWFVGWLECPDETYVFALNMDMPDTRYLSWRKNMTYSILQDIGAFNCD